MRQTIIKCKHMPKIFTLHAQLCKANEEKERVIYTHTTAQLLDNIEIFKNSRLENIIWLHASNIVRLC